MTHEGSLVRLDRIAAPQATIAWRLLYRSTSVSGLPVQVSGLVVVPDTPPPGNGFPVLAWAHGTTGLADRCAPSAASRALDGAPGELPVPPFWERGFAVVATDYEGLGTPGRHPYLVGESEARSILDAVRAARAIDEARASGPVIVIGASQGGHAALFTGEIAPRYSPELPIRGIVALAPATELALASRIGLADPDATGFAVAIAAGFEAAYADARLADVLTPAYRDRAGIVDEGCMGDVLAAFEGPATTVLRLDRLARSPWPELIERNTPGRSPSPMPIYVGQGGLDPLVVPEFTDAYVVRSCEAGNDVTYRRYPHSDHDAILDWAATDVLAWIREVLDGRHVRATGCPG